MTRLRASLADAIWQWLADTAVIVFERSRRRAAPREGIA